MGFHNFRRNKSFLESKIDVTQKLPQFLVLINWSSVGGSKPVVNATISRLRDARPNQVLRRGSLPKEAQVA